MWIVNVALSRPYTFVVLVLLLFLLGPVMLLRTPVDIFPAINVPVVSVIWTYTGMAPSEMETRITSNYERGLTSVVENVEHMESQTLNGVSVINVYLQPDSSRGICLSHWPRPSSSHSGHHIFSRAPFFPRLVYFLLRREVERHRHPDAHQNRGRFTRLHDRFEHGFERVQQTYTGLLHLCLDRRALFASSFLGFCVLSLLLAPVLGRDFFPSVDTGQFRLHVRAKTGTRIEETARLVDQVERSIRNKIPASEFGGILDNIGVPTSGINLAYSNSGIVGSADAEVLASLQPNHRPTAEYVAKLREELSKESPGTSFFFEPADIVSQTLNFGVPAPLDVQIAGEDLADNFAIATQIAAKMRLIPGEVDVHFQQLYDQPRLQFDIDRVRAQQVGLSERDISSGVLVSLSSSYQTSPNLWLNPENGVSYNLAVQVPEYKANFLNALGTIPITSSTTSTPQLFENVTTMRRMDEPAVSSHYNVHPVIDIYANVQNRDLGSIAADVAKITDEAKKHLPRGSDLVTRGQVATMQSSFVGLLGGLGFAILLVYLLPVVNFQSWTEAFIIITALPGALAGICWILFLTHTSLSVPAMTGAIMSIGVATANSVLVVSFANQRFAETKGCHPLGMGAGATRLRPVMMTAMAMIIGMVPMALGLGEGGEQNAPLGRAVIGGLFFATIATLFFVPTVFAIVCQRNEATGLPVEMQHAS
jgi:multidrug efflux pump subunit AcrB